MTKKIEQLIRSEVVLIVVWCNGSTSEFDSDSEGSIPSTTANVVLGYMVNPQVVTLKNMVRVHEIAPIERKLKWRKHWTFNPDIEGSTPSRSTRFLMS